MPWRDLADISQLASHQHVRQPRRASGRIFEHANRAALLMATSGAGNNVLGLGTCGVDYIALVDKHPDPDSKIRTTGFQIVGGGNVGNTLTCASRLGLTASVVTKVGDDANGRLILEGLESEGIDTKHVVVRPGHTSPFTYVIVDTSAGTRTCIHTPQTEELRPEEITEDLLTGVDLLHLDARHTIAAVQLANLAVERRIPVVLDAEKDRPHFRELFPKVDYVVTSTTFATEFTGRADRLEAMCELLSMGRAKLVISTLGGDGSVCVYRPEQCWDGFEADDLPEDAPVQMFKLTPPRPEFRAFACTAWPVEGAIVDTTGAGDAFIGGIIYAVLHRLSASKALALGGFIASQKLKAPGARAGIPSRQLVLETCPGLLETSAKSA